MAKSILEWIVNLEEIDKLLADWRFKLDVVGQNLIDLHGIDAYQRLYGVSGFPRVELTGVTQTRVNPVLHVMNELFQNFDLLVQTIDKAVQLRGLIPRFLPSPQKIQEIEDLLIKPSIHLSIETIPLARRGLLSSAQTINAITPEELLRLMTSAFQAAKDVVLAVDEVWSRLEPSLIDIEIETRQLQHLAESLNIDCSEEIACLSQKLKQQRAKIDSDPLGVNEKFLKSVQPQIEKLSAMLQQVRQQQESVRLGLVTARSDLSNLQKIHHQAEIAYDESKRKIADHSKLQNPLTLEEIQALEVWLSRLEIKFNEGLFNPVRVGLDNWTAKVKEYIAKEKNAYAANQAPLNLRAELRGRLDALVAKALARGFVEDTVLQEVAQQAKQILFTNPTPLDEAAELVSKYEKRLNSYPNLREVVL
ncbi:hypothetical protein NIES4071_97290 [Calothrix sp. NIES-4071]|nr:hypothetical protein NIES4071_97290 [Calothrix sp. NIES-4071]BAZ63994.1 hypothetical protein NIES4105_97220 [Calothrix sp. NIES-4105]